jgi:hypothetical protein
MVNGASNPAPFFRPDGRPPMHESRQPAQPAIHIGHIDIVVEAPPASAPPTPPAPARPVGDLLSRHYLRGL